MQNGVHAQLDTFHLFGYILKVYHTKGQAEINKIPVMDYD